MSIPAALASYYFRWCMLALLGGLRGDVAARARRWAHWERRFRPSPDGPAMAAIDYHAYRYLRTRWPLRTALAMLTLPVHASVRAFRAAARFGGEARRAHSQSTLSQGLEISLLALRYPITYGSDPSLYYMQEVFDPDRRGDAPYVFSNLHHTMLSLMLNAGRTGGMSKSGFERRCAEHDLPHIRSIARVRPDGEITWLGEPAELPDHDIFSKPAVGMKGRGAARWLRQPDGRYRCESGALLDAEQVQDALRRAAAGTAWIIQPCVRNHPEVEALVGATLATVRIVSVLTSAGEFQAVLAIHRSAPDDAATDNADRGGVASAIDLRTGSLGPVMCVDRTGVRFTATHPRTGADVVGAKLPFWAETLALAERAHRQGFDRAPVIGWDIALTATGPVLVEANPAPGAKSLQAAQRSALGRSPYPVRLLELCESAGGRGRRRPSPDNVAVPTADADLSGD
jgi:hypothetical protein